MLFANDQRAISNMVVVGPQAHPKNNNKSQFDVLNVQSCGCQPFYKPEIHDPVDQLNK